jgi:hypothetical protein
MNIADTTATTGATTSACSSLLLVLLHRVCAGQQRGAVFEAHPGARRFGAALLLPCALAGPRLVGFVVVDPVSSVVPVSL